MGAMHVEMGTEAARVGEKYTRLPVFIYFFFPIFKKSEYPFEINGLHL